MEHYATSLQHILAEQGCFDLLFLISVRIQPSLSESGEAQMHTRIIHQDDLCEGSVGDLWESAEWRV
jgi:hypothetical protein